MASSSASPDASSSAHSNLLDTAHTREPLPEDSVAHFPFLKLPPELRTRIYGYVFGASQAIRPDIRTCQRRNWANRWDIHDYDEDDDWPRSAWDDERAVKTSILTVCRLVKAEAIEVLYDTKILRGWPIDLDVMLRSRDISNHVRRIEITELLECVDRHHPSSSARHSRHLRDMLERLQRLPRLRSILILSDCLTRKSRYVSDTWVSVSDFVRAAGLEPATCVDVGRYQLHGKFKNIQIVNSKLIEMWPAVRDTPEDYDGFDEAVAVINNLQSSIDVPNVAAWASHTSLRCWVDIQQQFLALIVSGTWNELLEKVSSGAFDDDDDDITDDKFKYEFFNRAARAAVRVPIFTNPLLQSGEHVMKRLRPNDNSDVLNMVSHFLAVNIALYIHHTDHPSIDAEWELRPIAWKTEGESIDKTGLQYMAEQQSVALMGGASKEFVLDPSLEHDVPGCNLIERKLFMEWIKVFDNRDWTTGLRCWDNPNPTDTKQLTWLHLAVLQPFAQDSNNQHRRDDWAKGLLVRYMMASSRLHHDAVARASLADLRTMMSIVIDLLGADRYSESGKWVKSFASDAAVPLDFDDDVYPGLGWKYGKLLAQAFERYTSQGRVSKTLARQWAKEGTMWA